MLRKLKSCFVYEEVNIGRQPELDIVKGMAIIFMVLCHTFERLSLWSSRALEIVLDCLLGGPFAAAVFMFCMGIGICYSRNHQPKSLFLRGCKLLLIGFVLEICRDVIPNLIYEIIEGNLTLSEGLFPLIESLINIDVDILQFAGIFFIVFSLLIKLKMKPLHLALLAVIFSFLGQKLRFISTGNTYIDIIAGYIWLSHGQVWFPFLNWFIVPIAGYIFGLLWRRCKDKETFYQYVTPVCWVITILYLGFTFPDKGIYVHAFYYGIGLKDAFFVLVLVMATIGLGHFGGKYLGTRAKPLYWMSLNINQIYCVHWVIISFISLGMYFGVPVYYVPDALVIPVGFLILAVSCFIVALFNKFCTRIGKR